MIAIILLIAFIALLAWVVYAAGPKFALKRFGGALIVLLLVTFGVSAMLKLASADEATQQALEELGVSRNSEPCVSALGVGASVDDVNECVEERGLDQNVFAQYGTWVEQVVIDRDLGFAFYKNREKLSDTMRQRLPRTAWLFLYSQITALLIAVPLGIWSAYQANRGGRNFPRWLLPVGIGILLLIGLFGGFRLTSLFALIIAVGAIYSIVAGGRLADNNTNFLAFALLSIPVFVLAETLRYAFAIERDVYQLTGYEPWSAGAFEHFKSIWLPALVLGMAASPVYLRLLRADMIQNLQQDFVSVAKAKGMSNTHILLRHVLRPSTVTLMTVLGLNIAQLVNGAIVVEFIYDLDGMGSYLIQAFSRREFFAVQTIVALVAALFILTNTVIDVMYTAVDPRVKAEDDK
ncbi:MAG: ABC transporter permease [Ilumatobacter sp.]|uniref:ABC transporter permease n=1 Tax=Ilumatobacter sp. TaxID=1967498 RepID=UPI003C73812A